MSRDERNLVVTATHGVDHELSAIALTIVLGAVTAGLKGSPFSPVPASSPPARAPCANCSKAERPL